MTYDEYVSSMAVLMSISPESTLSGSPLLQRMIEYAEKRIYRELDLLHLYESADTADMSVGTRTISVPESMIVVQSVGCCTVASTASNATTVAPLQRISMDMMNFIYPAVAETGFPAHYAMLDDDTIVVGYTPSAAYRLRCYGQVMPELLSEDNDVDFLSTELPDLLIAASAVFGFGGILKNFGAQAEDPATAQSWENQYQLLKQGVDLISMRQKASSVSWTPFQPAPLAKESRT